jgi:hypothetical protein
MPPCLGMVAISAFVNLRMPSRALPDADCYGLGYIGAHGIFVLIQSKLSTALRAFSKIPKPYFITTKYDAYKKEKGDWNLNAHDSDDV